MATTQIPCPGPKCDGLVGISIRFDQQIITGDYLQNTTRYHLFIRTEKCSKCGIIVFKDLSSFTVRWKEKGKK